MAYKGKKGSMKNDNKARPVHPVANKDTVNKFSMEVPVNKKGTKKGKT